MSSDKLPFACPDFSFKREAMDNKPSYDYRQCRRKKSAICAHHVFSRAMMFRSSIVNMPDHFDKVLRNMGFVLMG